MVLHICQVLVALAHHELEVADQNLLSHRHKTLIAIDAGSEHVLWRYDNKCQALHQQWVLECVPADTSPIAAERVRNRMSLMSHQRVWRPTTRSMSNSAVLLHKQVNFVALESCQQLHVSNLHMVSYSFALLLSKISRHKAMMHCAASKSGCACATLSAEVQCFGHEQAHPSRLYKSSRWLCVLSRILRLLLHLKLC